MPSGSADRSESSHGGIGARIANKLSVFSCQLSESLMQFLLTTDNWQLTTTFTPFWLLAPGSFPSLPPLANCSPRTSSVSFRMPAGISGDMGMTLTGRRECKKGATVTLDAPPTVFGEKPPLFPHESAVCSLAHRYYQCLLVVIVTRPCHSHQMTQLQGRLAQGRQLCTGHAGDGSP